jgi:hypothetical protein
MSKLSRIALGAVGVGVALTLAHAWMNLGLDPLRLVGLKPKEVNANRFKVGFLPVT